MASASSSRLWQRFWALLRVARLLPSYLLFAVLKHVWPLAKLTRRAWREGSAAGRDPVVERRLIGDVDRIRSRLGRGRDCLQASLLLYRELSRLGASPTLEVGFRRTTAGTEGHAWVVLDGTPLLEAHAGETFVTTMRFGRFGALLGGGEVEEAGGTEMIERLM